MINNSKLSVLLYTKLSYRTECHLLKKHSKHRHSVQINPSRYKYVFIEPNIFTEVHEIHWLDLFTLQVLHFFSWIQKKKKKFYLRNNRSFNGKCILFIVIPTGSACFYTMRHYTGYILSIFHCTFFERFNLGCVSKNRSLIFGVSVTSKRWAIGWSRKTFSNVEKWIYLLVLFNR